MVTVAFLVVNMGRLDGPHQEFRWMLYSHL